MELKKNPEEQARSESSSASQFAPDGPGSYGGLDSTYNDGMTLGNGDDPFFDPERDFDPVTPMMTAGMNYGIDNGGVGTNPMSQQPSGYNNGDNYNTYNTRYSSVNDAPKRMLTKKEFLNKMALRKTKDKMNYSAIGLMACGVISMLASWFIIDTVLKPMYGTLDYMSESMGMDATESLPDLQLLWASVVIINLIIIGLGIGVMFFQSRVCAGIALALSAYNMISSIVQMHRASGWLPFLASIYAVYATIEFANAWKQYETTGHYPGVD